VTKDVSQYTKAALFQPGRQDGHAGAFFQASPASRGSPRHPGATPRGFRVEVLHTVRANYDMVGNDTPGYSFIRDPMKFQHFIRSQKRRADSNLRDHDMQWDFWTPVPGRRLTR